MHTVISEPLKEGAYLGTDAIHSGYIVCVHACVRACVCLCEGTHPFIGQGNKCFRLRLQVLSCKSRLQRNLKHQLSKIVPIQCRTAPYEVAWGCTILDHTSHTAVPTQVFGLT